MITLKDAKEAAESIVNTLKNLFSLIYRMRKDWNK